MPADPAYLFESESYNRIAIIVLGLTLTLDGQQQALEICYAYDRKIRNH